MAYQKPDVFVNVTIAEPSVAAITPTLNPTMVAVHFFVAFKEEVVQAGKSTYEGLQLDDVDYPALPKQSITTASDLLVDIGELTAAANDAQGVPQTERFDPNIYVTNSSGVEVEISLAEGVFVKKDGFDLPGNMTYDAVTGTWLTTKGNIVDHDMEVVGVADWTTIETTNAPGLLKEVAEPDFKNTQSLEVTLDAVPAVGDGVKSTAFTVIPLETFKAIIRSKTDSGDSVDFELQVWDEVADGLILGVTGKSNTTFDTEEISFVVPANCTSITIRALCEAATANAIFYLGNVDLQYTGADALSGQVSISYRALEEKFSGQRLRALSAASTTDLTNFFGTAGLGPSNPLGFLMYNAFIHSNMVIKGIAVGNPKDPGGASTYTGDLTDEVLSFSATHTFMDESPQDYYAIAYGTFTQAVREAGLAWVTNLKGTESRLIVGVDLSDTNEFLAGVDGTLMGEFSSATHGPFTDGDQITYLGNNFDVVVRDGKAYVALPLSNDTSSIVFDEPVGGSNFTDGVFTIDDAAGVTQAFQSVTGGNFTTNGYRQVKVNDTLEIPKSGNTGIYKVLTVYSDAIIVEFTSGTEQVPGLNKGYKFYRFMTLDGTSTGIADRVQQAEVARDRAISYSDSRLIMVVPGWVAATINGVLTDVESWYPAAQLATEMCQPLDLTATPPRGPGFTLGHGFTGFQESLTHVFKSSRYFTDSPGGELDIMAGGGNAILINDNPGEALRLRHSLTTDMSSIETQEIMMGVARDYSAKTFRSTLRTIIKKIRISTETSSAIMIRVNAVKALLVGAEQVMREIEFTELKSGATPDSAILNGTWVQHYPLNRLDTNFDVIQPTAFEIST